MRTLHMYIYHYYVYMMALGLFHVHGDVTRRGEIIKTPKFILIVTTYCRVLKKVIIQVHYKPMMCTKGTFKYSSSTKGYK